MFFKRDMDWNFSIERNRGDLLPVVLGLFAMIGLAEGSVVDRLSRPVYRKAARILRSAEAAVRRLIVVMARNIVVEPRPKRARPAGLLRSRKGTFQSKGKATSHGQDQSQREPRPPSFNLFDPEKRSDAGRVRRRRRHKGPEPRIRFIGYDPRIPEPLRSIFSTAGPWPAPALTPKQVEIVKDNTVNAKRLCRRIFALMGALKDLPRQAKRLALWQAKPVEERRPRRERALRFGWPPGWRVKATHEVDDILKECHWLVRSLPEPDTS
jgi:hypothetical protein